MAKYPVSPKYEGESNARVRSMADLGNRTLIAALRFVAADEGDRKCAGSIDTYNINLAARLEQLVPEETAEYIARARREGEDEAWRLYSQLPRSW